MSARGAVGRRSAKAATTPPVSPKRWPCQLTPEAADQDHGEHGAGEAAEPAEGGYEAEDQQRDAVGRDMAPAVVEERGGHDVEQFAGLAGGDAMAVQTVAGGEVDGLQNPGVLCRIGSGVWIPGLQ